MNYQFQRTTVKNVVNTQKCFSIFCMLFMVNKQFIYLGLTPYKVEKPLQSAEIQGKGQDKQEKYIGNPTL